MKRYISWLIARIEDYMYFYRNNRRHIPPMLRSLYGFMKELTIGSLPEPINAQFAMRALRPSDTVIEVGARTGGTTRIISGLVGKEGSVLSLEPNPFCIGVLLKNTSRMKNVRVLNIAASDENGFRNLSMNSIYDGAATLVTKDGWKRKRVRTMRLDDVVRLLRIPRVDALILDVEGSEFEVLKGSYNILKYVRIVIVELHYSLNAEGVQAAQALLSDSGFELVDQKTESEMPLVKVRMYRRIVVL